MNTIIVFSVLENVHSSTKKWSTWAVNQSKTPTTLTSVELPSSSTVCTWATSWPSETTSDWRTWRTSAPDGDSSQAMTVWRSSITTTISEDMVPVVLFSLISSRETTRSLMLSWWLGLMPSFRSCRVMTSQWMLTGRVHLLIQMATLIPSLLIRKIFSVYFWGKFGKYNWSLIIFDLESNIVVTFVF